MADKLQKIPLTQALQKGDDLWISPQLDASKWSKKIDWYLNCQISRTQSHQSVKFSAKLKELINQHQIDFLEVSIASHAPLMIASASLLPNRWTIILPFENNLKVWLEHCYRILGLFKSQNCRLFLPDTVTEVEFEKLWKTNAPAELEISYISESIH